MLPAGAAYTEITRSRELWDCCCSLILVSLWPQRLRETCAVNMSCTSWCMYIYVHAHAHAPVRTMYRCSMHGTKPLYSKSASNFGPKHHAMRVLVNRSSTRGRTFVWRTAPATHAAAPSFCGRRQPLKLLVHESMLLAGVLAGGWREALRFVV